MEELSENPKPSLFCDLYKATIQIDQNKRRNKLLEEQKSRREKLFDEARGITEYLEVSKNVKKIKGRKYNNKIMFSEWFVEIPEDFDVSWFMKVCPKGHRCLVVAKKSSTKSFSKFGQYECKFKSELPGGSYSTCKKQKITILDCIWCETTKTFYILDVLVWSNQDFTNCTAEFRFFWLQSKISETPELEIISSNNTYSFKYVPHTLCEFLTIKDKLETFPYFDNDLPEVDGLLFYHKEASYTSGTTPLVGWLKPYMVPEILNVFVAENYLRQKPEKYVNLTEHIQYGKLMKRNKTKNKVEEMEIVG